MMKTKSQPSQLIFMESGKILRSSLLKNVAGIPFRNTIFFHLFLMTIFSISMTGGNPVKGKYTQYFDLCNEIYKTGPQIIKKNHYFIMALF